MKISSLQKAYRWYANRQEFLNALKTKETKALPITRTSIPGVSFKLCNVKALFGRERKRADWMEYLQAVLREEFEHHSSAGVQMSRPLFQCIAVLLLQ